MYIRTVRISGQQSWCLQLRSGSAHQLCEFGMRGCQQATEAALLHPPLRKFRLRGTGPPLAPPRHRHCFSGENCAGLATNYTECLKYYHGKAYVIISKTMIFQNSDDVVVWCEVRIRALFTRPAITSHIGKWRRSNAHRLRIKLGKRKKKKKQRLEERNVRNYVLLKTIFYENAKINEEEWKWSDDVCRWVLGRDVYWAGSPRLNNDGVSDI